MINTFYKPALPVLYLFAFFYAGAQQQAKQQLVSVPVIEGIETPYDSNQLNGNTKPQVFTFVEQNPQFPGGDAAIIEFLQRHIQYPAMERDNNIQGKVLLRFVILEDGSVDDVQVVRRVSKGLDAEAVRVAKMLPKFIPGKMRGKPVRVYFNLPIVFKLQNDADNGGITKLTVTNKAFADGYTDFKNYDYTLAIPSFLRAAQASNTAIVYDLLGECYRYVNNYNDMCSAYKKALSLGSKTAQNKINLYCK